MKKKILILCTGNSCRSILAEALVNAKLGDKIFAQSSGVKASMCVNPNAKALLERRGYWRDEYHSKVIESVIDKDFDLVVTVCDHAKETCPIFIKAIKTIHVNFTDPSGKDIKEYVKTLDLIEEILLPIIQNELFE